MSSFFTKNRDTTGPRWQKKPAINSQNDRFTIYAHMQPLINNINNNGANASSNTNMNNTNNVFSRPSQQRNIQLNYNCRYPQQTNLDENEDQFEQETRVPHTHHQVVKMKQALQAFQYINSNAYPHQGLGFDDGVHYPQGTEYPPTTQPGYDRNTQSVRYNHPCNKQPINSKKDRQRVKKYSNQQNKLSIGQNTHLMGRNNPKTDRSLYQQFSEPIPKQESHQSNLHTQTNLQQNINTVNSKQLRMSNNDFAEDDYNKKLDIMRQRLEMISRKEYDNSSNSHSHSYSNSNINNRVPHTHTDNGYVRSPNSSIGSTYTHSQNNRGNYGHHHNHSQQTTKRQSIYHKHYNKNSNSNNNNKWNNKGNTNMEHSRDKQLYNLSKNIDLFNEDKPKNNSRELNPNTNYIDSSAANSMPNSIANTISIQRSKNTAPMPNIIHQYEQQAELQKQLKISSTLQIQNHINKQKQKEKLSKIGKYIEKEKQRSENDDKVQAALREPKYDTYKLNTNGQPYDMTTPDPSRYSKNYANPSMSQKNYNNNTNYSGNSSYNNTSANPKQNAGMGLNNKNSNNRISSNINNQNESKSKMGKQAASKPIHKFQQTPVSNKKQKQQFYYYELYPNLSEEIDANIYKDHNASDAKGRQYVPPLEQEPQQIENRSKSKSKYIKNANNTSNGNINSSSRVANSRNQGHIGKSAIFNTNTNINDNIHQKQQYRQMKQQIENMRNSVWMIVDANKNKSNPNKEINQPIKRRQTYSGAGSYNIANKNGNKSDHIFIQQKHIKQLQKQISKNKSNSQNRSMSRSISKTKVNGSEGSKYSNKYSNKPVYTIQEHTQPNSSMNSINNINVIKFANKKDNSSSLNINNPNLKYDINLTSQMNQRQNNLKHVSKIQPNESKITKSIINHFRVHRAKINQIVMQEIDGGDVSMFSASADYEVTYHKHNIQSNTIISQPLYRHKGPVTCLLKIDNTLITASRDKYLKHCTFTPPSINQSNQSLYRLEQHPLNINCINQHKILIGCTSQLLIFDVKEWKINRQISLNSIGIRSQPYRVMENLYHMYVGTADGLYCVDYRASNPMIGVLTNLPNICSWIIHPFEQFCLVQYQNKLQHIDFRYIKKPNPLSVPVSNSNSYNSSYNNSLNNTNASYNNDWSNGIQLGLNNGENVISYCWGALGAGVGSLGMLTQQIVESNIYYNRLIRWDVNNASYSYISLDNQNANSTYTGSNRNSLIIVRQWNDNYYVGDRMGNLYHIERETHQYGRQPSAKFLKNYYQQDMQRQYMQDQFNM